MGLIKTRQFLKRIRSPAAGLVLYYFRHTNFYFFVIFKCILVARINYDKLINKIELNSDQINDHKASPRPKRISVIFKKLN